MLWERGCESYVKEAFYAQLKHRAKQSTGTEVNSSFSRVLCRDVHRFDAYFNFRAQKKTQQIQATTNSSDKVSETRKLNIEIQIE